MGIKCYLFLFFISVGVAVEAQTVQGCVTDAVSGKPLYYVDVINVNTSQVAHTDESGNYSMPAKIGDTIKYAAMGYKTVTITKPQSVIIATLNITMDRVNYQLQNFTFKFNSLTQYQMDSARRAATYIKALGQRPASPFNSPVSAIAEQFNARAKEVSRFQKEFKEGEVEKFIDTRYKPEMVALLTGLTGDSIGNFMYAYPMPYDFARTATDIEIKIWIRENYKEWIKK